MGHKYLTLIPIIGLIVFTHLPGAVRSANESLVIGPLNGWYTDKGQTTSDSGILSWFLYEDKLYSVCDFSATTRRPTNWLRSDFIDFNGAKSVIITISYTLRKCKKGNPFCIETFKLYTEQTSKAASKPAPPKGFQEIAIAKPTIIPDRPTGIGDSNIMNVSIVAKLDGFYLAFYDEGACLTLRSVQVSYYFCPEQGAYLDLVAFPKTTSPVDNSVANQVKAEGTCSDPNARNTTALTAVCTKHGVWKLNENVKCMCKAGYGYSETPIKHCTVCGKGDYKSTVNNTSCKTCPIGSYSDAQRTICRCSSGLYRMNKNDNDEPCSALPEAPIFANTTTWNNTSILVTWPPSQDDPSITYVVECFVCKDKMDKKCVDRCPERTIYFPSNSGLLKSVSVSGLLSGTRFMFKVYAVTKLNEVTERLNWKFAVTYGKTEIGPSDPGTKGTNSEQIEKLLLTIGLPVIAILVLIIVLCGVFLWRRSTRKFGRVPAYDLNDSHELPTMGQRVYIDPTNYDDPEEALKNFAKELDKCSLVLEKVIGGGEFGDVYKGVLKRSGEEEIGVAVKTLKNGSTKKNRDDFLLEASVMGQFCDPNVIYLEGVITKSNPLMIVTEFMSNGSLDNFLKEMDSRLSVLQMLGMARGVSSGMKFLSEMNFVHRDLAARNILVSDNLVCKVADFGLSRELEDSAYETKGGKIPVRWTAPEAIKFRKFSASSDVWSYGIMLWEIMSFAERPYWDWSNFEVMDRVEGGFRLPPPMQCPTAVHQVMLDCWNAERAERPKFADIVKHLDILIRSPEKLKENLHIQPAQPSIDYTDVTTIEEWLKSIKMGQYSDRFVQAGYNNLKHLAEFEEPNLEELGIKLIGHKNKIKKSIRDVRKKLHRESSVPV